MSVITIDILKKKNLMEQAEQAIKDISECMSVPSDTQDVKIVLAAYVLYRVSTYNDPMSFEYQQLLRTDFGHHGDGFSLAIAEMISREEWGCLLPLVKKYSSEIFALAAFTNDLSSVSKAGDAEATPKSIIKLAQEILKISAGDSVADLCCGYGSFLTDSAITEPDAAYVGYEINTRKMLIANIRGHLVSDNIEIVFRDAFELLENTDTRSFNKIFSNYPFRLPLKHLVAGSKFLKQLTEKIPGLSKTTSSDWFFNALLCELLEDRGKAVGIMTTGSAWNGIDAPIRKYFVENGLIESVITLPDRVFSFTSAATSMIVFSKGNSAVRLVNASQICQKGRRYNEFNDNDIATIIAALSTDTNYSKMVDVRELRENEYTLSLSRYLKDDISFENAIPFGDVIKSISRGAPCTAKQLDDMISNEETNMQYLMLANIQNGIIDDKLPYLSHIDPKFEKYCLKNNDLILSKNGYPYKIAIANIKDGKKVLANGNLYIIELDEKRVDPYYIKAFLESEQGIAVLKSISAGAVLPNIGVDKLKSVEIPVPPLDEQKRISEHYQSILDEIAIYKAKTERALNRLRHVYDEESEEQPC